MGGSRFSDDDWRTYSSTTATKSRDAIFRSRHLDPLLDPKGVKIRESRDSDANPNSTAIIIALDETGSMGSIAEYMAKKDLGVLFSNIYARLPVPDPHIMLMGIGDMECDQAPLQVGQFEAGLPPLTEQLEKLYLEGAGGGNHYESYIAAWYFAATHTSIDCFEKRGKKGLLFTIGDEEPTKYLRRVDIERFIGDSVQSDLSPEDLLEMVSRTYDVFHVMVEEGSYYQSHGDRVKPAWRKLLGQRAIPLSDHNALGEVITSAIEVNAGRDADAVIGSWSGSTAVAVKHAVGGMLKTSDTAGSGPVRL